MGRQKCQNAAPRYGGQSRLRLVPSTATTKPTDGHACHLHPTAPATVATVSITAARVAPHFAGGFVPKPPLDEGQLRPTMSALELAAEGGRGEGGHLHTTATTTADTVKNIRA
jgi:hypothetical protein